MHQRGIYEWPQVWGGGGAPSLVSDATPVQVCSGRGGGADSFGALSRCQPGCGLVWESNLGRIERVTGDNVRQPQRLQIISMMSDLSGRRTGGRARRERRLDSGVPFPPLRAIAFLFLHPEL